jgi:guanylate kinase
MSNSRLYIVSAPAGTGKTTLVSLLTEEFPLVVTSVSYTTRKPRPGEIEGVHYHFVSREEFEGHIAQDEFLEYVELYGEYYGTSKEWVKHALQQGKHVILTIDTQGALQLKEKQIFEAVYIFIEPPSLTVLQERLKRRKTETAEAIVKRLEWAKQEVMAARLYDYSIVNEDLKTAYDALRSIIIAEQHKIIKRGV